MGREMSQNPAIEMEQDEEESVLLEPKKVSSPPPLWTGHHRFSRIMVLVRYAILLAGLIAAIVIVLVYKHDLDTASSSSTDSTFTVSSFYTLRDGQFGTEYVDRIVYALYPLSNTLRITSALATLGATNTSSLSPTSRRP